MAVTETDFVAPPVDTGPDPNRFRALAVIAIAQLMIVLDATVVTIALPSAQKALGLSVNDRQWVLTAERGHSARVRRADTNEPIGPPLKHGSTVLHAAFDADNKRVVTGSDDNQARIWDVETGELLARPMPHRSAVEYVAFCPDGLLVLTASTNHLARVWDAGTGEPVTPPLRFTGAVAQAGFHIDRVAMADQVDQHRRSVPRPRSGVNPLTPIVLRRRRSYEPDAVRPRRLRPGRLR